MIPPFSNPHGLPSSIKTVSRSEVFGNSEGSGDTILGGDKSILVDKLELIQRSFLDVGEVESRKKKRRKVDGQFEFDTGTQDSVCMF
jgi:hypothetical protein